MKKFYILILVASFFNLKATIHTVFFGTHYGNNYTPNAMIINLGDTVLFSGTFPLLPLQSSILPVGAATFSCSTGADFMYIPTVLGTHNYKCSVDTIMTGSFYVQSNVGVKNLTSNEISCTYNPLNESISIANLDATNFETRIFAVTGELVYQGLNEKEIRITENFVKNSYYFLQIQKNKYIFTKKIFIY